MFSRRSCSTTYVGCVQLVICPGSADAPLGESQAPLASVPVSAVQPAVSMLPPPDAPPVAEAPAASSGLQLAPDAPPPASTPEPSAAAPSAESPRTFRTYQQILTTSTLLYTAVLGMLSILCGSCACVFRIVLPLSVFLVQLGASLAWPCSPRRGTTLPYERFRAVPKRCQCCVFI